MKKKILIGVGILAVLAAIVYANLNFTKTGGLSVTTEKIARRDLEAIVTASGTIQPIRSLNVGAESPGRVVDLQVHEGDIVKEGQFLLQVDPRNLQISADSMSAGLAAARSQIEETQRSLDNLKLQSLQAKAAFDRQEGLLKSSLTSREAYENAKSAYDMSKVGVAQAEQSIRTQETRLKQQEAGVQNAQYDLSKSRLTSPINGVVTKRSVELGEMVSGSQFSASNLITIADMSVVVAEIQVDETDIPNVRAGQVAKVTIDALPDQTFTAKVTEVGNSPIAASGASSGARATDFKVKVTLDKEIKGVRPGFTCTAVITTATRSKVISLPIQAGTVREMVIDEKGQIVRPPAGRAGQPPKPTTMAAATELKPGETRKEIEGVFLVKDGHAVFTPIKSGIAGDKYYEVLEGLKEGDEIITGPFASVRTLKDGDAVKSSGGVTPAGAPKPGSK
jgi:HlyD family secretion protein